MRKTIAAAFLLAVTSGALAGDGPYSRASILAHRGVAQQYDRSGLDRTTCTAERMTPPRHGFLENTIESMAAAFRLGANVVEFDIHPTTDGEFVVFHDWTVDCRTNGKGVTRQQTLAYLKSLDIGHGYTADGGQTFPFRGKFFGAMPTWAEVMEAFPHSRFLVNIKSNDPREGRAAVEYARKRGYGTERIAFYGADRPMDEIRRAWPEMRTLSRGRLKDCLLTYIATGWSGYVPDACHNAIVYVPINYATLLWGWPARFVERLAAVGSEVYVVGPFGEQTIGTTGIDTMEQLSALPPDFNGGIVTDRIDVLGPALDRGALPRQFGGIDRRPVISPPPAPRLRRARGRRQPSRRNPRRRSFPT